MIASPPMFAFSFLEMLFDFTE